MPIDFKQIAAPSFSDSNTLVALAAKQQQEAMAGIQGAWTGAMDAVGNRVQGEMEGIANQASFSQLTDPTQRAALDAQLLDANTLGMGNVREMNKYVDSRIPTQLGRIASVNQEDRNVQGELDRIDTLNTQKTNDKELKDITDASWYLTDFQNKYDAAATDDERDLLATAANQELSKFGFTDIQMAKANALAQEQAQSVRVNNAKEQVAELGPQATQAQIDAIYQNIDASKVNTALAVQKQTSQAGASDRLANNKYAESLGLPGAYDKEGGKNYNTIMQTVNTNIAKAEQEAKAGSIDDLSYDQYLIQNQKTIEEMGLGSFIRGTSVGELQDHFNWAQKQGKPYTEKEKILATEGLMSGAIKLDLFTLSGNPFKQSGESMRIGKALKSDLLPKLMNEREIKSLKAGQDALLPAIQLGTRDGETPEEILTNLGITSSKHPQAKYLPSNFAAVLENKEQGLKSPATTTNEQPKTKPKVKVESILKGTTKDPQKAKTNPVDSITTDNMNKLTPKPVGKQKGTAKNLISPKTGQTIYQDKVTPEMAKEANVKVDSKGKLIMEPRFKGMKMDTPYGESITINNVKDLERFIGIKYSNHIKEVDNILAYNGKSKYQYPDDLSKPDTNHPLANKESDNLANFVPYDARNYDGSRKYKTKYSSYDMYRKTELKKRLKR